MASVVVYVPGTPAARPAHRKVTLANQAQAITFDLVGPATELSDLSSSWAVQPRPGFRKPITRKGPPKLARMALHVTMTKPDPQSSVEPDLLRLKSMGHSGLPVAVGYGTHTGSAIMTSSGFWVIDDLKVNVIARQQGSNDVARFDADLEFLEANIPGWHRPASLAKPAVAATYQLLFPVSAPTPTAAPSSTRPRSVTVAAGDTLVGLGIRFYDDSDLWRLIADANGISDPRAIRAGQVLRLP